MTIEAEQASLYQLVEQLISDINRIKKINKEIGVSTQHIELHGIELTNVERKLQSLEAKAVLLIDKAEMEFKDFSQCSRDELGDFKEKAGELLGVISENASSDYFRKEATVYFNRSKTFLYSAASVLTLSLMLLYFASTFREGYEIIIRIVSSLTLFSFAAYLIHKSNYYGAREAHMKDKSLKMATFSPLLHRLDLSNDESLKQEFSRIMFFNDDLNQQINNEGLFENISIIKKLLEGAKNKKDV